MKTKKLVFISSLYLIFILVFFSFKSINKPKDIKETKTKIYNHNQYSVHLINEDPTLNQKSIDTIINTFFAVYTKQAKRFNPNAPKVIDILIDPNYSGVAEAVYSKINISSNWMKTNPQDIDFITHEAFHVVQSYTFAENPNWAVEGLADYSRDRYGIYNQKSGWTLPPYNYSQSYKDSYRITARFFKWLELKKNKHILEDLDKTMRDSKYSPNLWIEKTGKSIDQLWKEYAINPDVS